MGSRERKECHQTFSVDREKKHNKGNLMSQVVLEFFNNAAICHLFATGELRRHEELDRDGEAKLGALCFSEYCLHCIEALGLTPSMGQGANFPSSQYCLLGSCHSVLEMACTGCMHFFPPLLWHFFDRYAPIGTNFNHEYWANTACKWFFPPRSWSLNLFQHHWLEFRVKADISAGTRSQRTVSDQTLIERELHVFQYAPCREKDGGISSTLKIQKQLRQEFSGGNLFCFLLFQRITTVAVQFFPLDKILSCYRFY